MTSVPALTPRLLLLLLSAWLPYTLSQLCQSQYRQESGRFAGVPSSETDAASRSACARRCTADQYCSGFTFRASSGSCLLFPHAETCMDESGTAADASYRLIKCSGGCSQQCGPGGTTTSDTCAGSLAFDQANNRCYYDYTQCTTTALTTTSEQPVKTESTTEQSTTAALTTAELTPAEPTSQTTLPPTTTVQTTTAEQTTTQTTTLEPTTTALTTLTTTALTTTLTTLTTSTQTTTTLTTTALTTTVAPTTAVPTTAQTATVAAQTTAGVQCAVTSFICPTNTAQFHFAKEDNCRQFYKCSNGCPVVFSCAADLSYNAAIQNCDWDYNTGCTAPPL